MGYRSDVKSLIYGDPEHMKVFIVKTKLLGAANALELFKDSIVIQTVKPEPNVELTCIELRGEDWKWYESYTDVIAWEKLLKDAEKDGLEYEFVRVGEESGDIDERRSDDSRFFISTCSYSDINY
jgi:hypothetical protein